MKTVGISPKAVLAAVLPTLGGVLAVGVQWLATGEFDRAEFATAIGTVAAALLAFAGAYAADPGTVKPSVPPYRDGEAGITLLEVLVVLLLVLVILALAGYMR